MVLKMNLFQKIPHILRISGCGQNILRYLNTHNSTNVTVPSLITQSQFIKNPWMWQQNDNIKFPVVNKTQLEMPTIPQWMPLSIKLPIEEQFIEAPSTEQSSIEKQAARLIVIRRKKMKKHKLKKLRKRMKFERAKIRQRRELKKEKVFQAELIKQCKEAEAFSAEKYVEERIKKLNEIIIPRRWKGKKLPEFLIREKMGLPPKK